MVLLSWKSTIAVERCANQSAPFQRIDVEVALAFVGVFVAALSRTRTSSKTV